MSGLTWKILFVLSQIQQFAPILCLANVTPGCSSDKLELIGALAKMSQVVTPAAQKAFFRISILHLAGPTWQPRF